MIVKVCDMIMGSGKTESAITQMNRDTSSRYIFITPYLDEVERIKQSCPDREFHDPCNKGDGKLEDLHALLRAGVNVASTHALFKTYNDTTKELIRDGNYKLILDEVAEVVKIQEVSKDDIELLLNDKMIVVGEDGRVRWNNEEYDGAFRDLRDQILTGHVIMYHGCLMLWEFPIEVFMAFHDVIVLTYMFDAQIQKYYFDMNHVEIQRIGTVFERGEYHFCDYSGVPEYVYTLPERIHILEDKKLNAIGDSYTSLSSSWYGRAKSSKQKPLLKQLKNNLTNVFINKFASLTGQNLWTTFKDYREVLKGKGYTKGFLSYNIRATNDYRDRDHLAYCVNVFYNPILKNYFVDHGVEIQEERYALSEMIQWIWRSSIRDGKEIWIYIPSRRMRELLKEWLSELSALKSNAEN